MKILWTRLLLSSLILCLSVFHLLFEALPALAQSSGHWSITYSYNGTTSYKTYGGAYENYKELVGDGTGHWNGPNGSFDNIYVNNVQAVEVGGSCTGSMSGTITATAAWTANQPGTSAGPPPQDAFFNVHPCAGWKGVPQDYNQGQQSFQSVVQPYLVNNTANDGYTSDVLTTYKGYSGDPVYDGDNFQSVSKGNHFVKKDGSSGVVTITVSLSSSFRLVVPNNAPYGYIILNVYCQDWLIVTPVTASLQGHSTADTANWDVSNPRFFSGTACTASATAVPSSGYLSHAQLCIGENGGDTVVKEYWDINTPGYSNSVSTGASVTTGSQLGSASLGAMFDSTHFMDGAQIILKLKVWDSNGGYYDGTIQGKAYNKSYVLTNHSFQFFLTYASLRDTLSGSLSSINYDSSLASSWHRTSIIKTNIPTTTAFYIDTHSNVDGFVDCYGDGGNTSESVEFYEIPALLAQKTPYQPPYNFAFIDGCHSAGHPGNPSTDGAAGFGITGTNPDIDRAFLGWQNFMSTVQDNDSWTKRMWQNMAKGYTLYTSCIMSSAQDPPIGCKADTGIDYIRLVPIGPTIIGDPVMKLHGVYGGDGAIGTLVAPDGSVTTAYDLAGQWFRPL